MITREEFLDFDSKVYFNNSVDLDKVITLITDYCSIKGKDGEWINKFIQGLTGVGQLLMSQTIPVLQEYYEKEFEIIKIVDLKNNKVIKIY